MKFHFIFNFLNKTYYLYCNLDCIHTHASLNNKHYFLVIPNLVGLSGMTESEEVQKILKLDLDPDIEKIRIADFKGIKDAFQKIEQRIDAGGLSTFYEGHYQGKRAVAKFCHYDDIETKNRILNEIIGRLNEKFFSIKISVLQKLGSKNIFRKPRAIFRVLNRCARYLKNMF